VGEPELVAEVARVLGALGRASLLDLAAAHGLEVEVEAGQVEEPALAAALAGHPALRLEEVVGDLLDGRELARLCRELGLAAGGLRAERARRVMAALARPAADAELLRGRWWPFPRARGYARSLGLLDAAEWHAFARGELREVVGVRPEGIPAAPWGVYRGHGWRGLRDWLDSARHGRGFGAWAPFKRARRFARGLGLRGRAERAACCRGERPKLPPRPGHVPRDPERVYGLAWRGWDDWLGRRAGGRPLGWRAFEAARAFARGLGLESAEAWRAYCRGERPDLGARPEDVPSAPHQAYAACGWVGYGDWLGTGGAPIEYALPWPFAEARAFARGLGLESRAEWRRYCQGELAGPGRAACRRRRIPRTRRPAGRATATGSGRGSSARASGRTGPSRPPGRGPGAWG